MPERPGLKLAEIPHQIRTQVQSLPDRWREFREAFQEDPAAIWHSPLTRIAGWILLGIVILVIGWLLIGMISPPDTGGGAFTTATPTATLYVACSNPNCAHDYTTRQKMDFDDWPLICPECGQESVYRATRCDVCRQWYSTAPGAPDACPHCAARAAQKPVEAAPTPDRPAVSDDAEDPW
jgi:hypothetical protein